MQEVRNKPTGNLSKGYRQRVGIAQALVHEPEVLVLDEPTAGLDPKQIGDTRELIKTLGGDHTVILSTHILPEVAITCDRVAIINRGRLVAHGTPESLTEQFRTTSVVDITVQGEPASVADVLSGFTDILSFERQERGESGATSWRLEIAKGADVRRSLSEQIVARGLGLLELRTGNGCFLSKILARAAWRTVATISSGRINPRAMKASARSPPSFPSPTMVSFLFNVSMRSLYLRFAVNWRRIDEARALHAAFAEAFFETILGARETFAPVILWPSK